MKVPYFEGLAPHKGPESCAGSREAVGEALTGEHTGQPLSGEIATSERRRSPLMRKATAERALCASPHLRSALSETLCMCGSLLCGNWEILSSSCENGSQERLGKRNRNPCVYDGKRSDASIVPEKLLNNDADSKASAETAEGRGALMRNTIQPATPGTQRPTKAITVTRTGWKGASAGLQRVRKVAARDKRCRFTALLHHVSVDLLRTSYYALKKEAAAGVDGVSWGEYQQEDFEKKLHRLYDRIHKGTYRALPSRRVYIPKSDGKVRPLGIAAIEDKIVQYAVATVLSAIYEVDFKGFSYGFRPKVGCHDALDALYVGIETKKVNWILDADIQSFFDSISHEWMLRFLEHRIADKRIIALVSKWLRAGISEGGKLSKMSAGTPQGAVISPLLANIFLHYVLDLWVDAWRKTKAMGDVIIVRYADDSVIGFQHKHEAENFLTLLGERLQKFSLALHPEKTRLIEFGRYAAASRRGRGEGKPESFDFLGFTHICSVTRKRKWFKILRITAKKRFRAKLASLKVALKIRMHEPVEDTGKWLQRAIRGYYQYFAVPDNTMTLSSFKLALKRIWLRTLRRRGQRKPMTWEVFNTFANKWIPDPTPLHPYPSVRFAAKYS